MENFQVTCTRVFFTLHYTNMHFMTTADQNRISKNTNVHLLGFDSQCKERLESLFAGVHPVNDLP